jgi:hypothetical protein
MLKNEFFKAVFLAYTINLHGISSSKDSKETPAFP